MKRLYLIAAAATLLAGCADSTGPLPDLDGVTTYELVDIEGLAWGTHPFTSFSGTRVLDHGEWTEVTDFVADNTARHIEDYGTYTVTRDRVTFFSRRTNNEHTGTLRGDEMELSPGELVWHWRRVR